MHLRLIQTFFFFFCYLMWEFKSSKDFLFLIEVNRYLDIFGSSEN